MKFFKIVLLFTLAVKLSYASDDLKKVKRGEAIEQIRKGVNFWHKHELDSATAYLKLAEQNSNLLNDNQLLLACYNNIGLLYMAKSEYNVSIDYLYKALELVEKIQNEKQRFQIMLNLSMANQRLGKYAEATKWLVKTQDFAIKIKSDHDLARCYLEFGIIKRKQGLFNSSIEYYKKALSKYQTINNETGILGALNNIGTNYEKLGENKKALDSYLEALNIVKKTNKRNYKARIYHNIGSLMFQLEQFQDAIDNLKLALKIKEEINDKAGIVSTCTLFGEIYTKSRNYRKAEHFLQRSKKLSIEINALDLQREVYLQLKNLYAAQNKGKEALAYYDKYINIKDSIFNTENMQHMQEMETRYQTREKEQQIEVLNIEKEAKANESFYMKIVLGVFLFSLLPLGFFVKQRQKTRILKERVAASNRECTKLGMELHDSISGSLTYLCRSMEKESVGESFVDQLRQVSDEVRGISHQLNMTAIANQEFRDALSDSLQLDHFPEDIDLKIYVPDGFEIDDYEKKINLIRIVQELKTNSLKHGNASSIVISFSRVQNKVRLDYSDNGIGFDLKEAKKGNGLHNIQERVELLSGKLDWQTSPGNGVSFHLTV